MGSSSGAVTEALPGVAEGKKVRLSITRAIKHPGSCDPWAVERIRVTSAEYR